MASVTGSAFHFVAAVLMLNSVHIIFPAIVMIAMPSGRELLRRKLPVQGRRIWFFTKLTLLLAAVAAFAILTAGGVVHLSGRYGEGAGILLMWFWALFPLFHGLRQSAGFSFLINQALAPQLGAEAHARLRIFGAQERKLFAVFHACVILAGILQTVKSPWARDGWSLPALALSAIAALLMGWHLVRIHREKSFANTHKLLFTSRMFLWQLAAYSAVAAWAVMSMHALEYIGLLNRMNRRESRANPKVIYWGMLVTLTSLIVFWEAMVYVRSQPNSALDRLVARDLTLTLLFALGPALTLLHYLIDAYMYRTRDPDVAATLGPYLAGFDNPPSAPPPKDISKAG